MEDIYINIWSTYTTVINNETWYLTDLYSFEMDALNLPFSKHCIKTEEYDCDDGHNSTIYTVWIHEKLLDLLYLKCPDISHSPKIIIDPVRFQASLNILKSYYGNLSNDI